MRHLRWTVMALTFCLLGLAQPSWTVASEVFRTFSQGDGAIVNWSDVEGSGFAGFLLFNEGGTPENQDAFVTYFILRTGDFAVVEFGFGSIPQADVSGSGNGAMRINTDTSAAANPGFTRLAGNGGRITLDVRKTSDFSQRISGTQQFRVGSFRLNSNGSETLLSGAVSGFVIVAEIGGDTSAQLASSRTLVIELVPGNP